MYKNFVLDPGHSRTLRACLSPHRLAVIKNNIFKRHSSQVVNQENSSRLELTPDSTKEQDRNAPIKYSISKAAGTKAYYYRFGGKPLRSSEVKWYSQASIIISLLSLLIYLFVREGNDVDIECGMSLGERMLKLQEFQLNLERNERIAAGGVPDDIDEEIQEIYNLREQYNYI